MQAGAFGGTAGSGGAIDAFGGTAGSGATIDAFAGGAIYIATGGTAGTGLAIDATGCLHGAAADDEAGDGILGHGPFVSTTSSSGTSRQYFKKSRNQVYIEYFPSLKLNPS